MARQFLSVAARVLALSALAVSPLLAEASETVEANTPPQGAIQLQRQQYSGLWPFYSRETFESGRVRISSLFQAIRFEWDPSGDYHHRVWPFFGASLTDEGVDRRLALYPLLYLHRDSPDADHNIVLPLFYHWRNRASTHTLLWPLFHVASLPSPHSSTAYRYFPVLFRRGEFEANGETSWNLGVPFVLDVMSGMSSATDKAVAIGAFFPWFGRPLPGLPLGYWHDNPRQWQAHLVPLFFAGGDHLEPSERYYTHTLPFSVWKRPDGSGGFAFPVLLSAWDAGEDFYSLHALWPLVHRRQNPTEEETRVLPLYYSYENLESPERWRFFSLFYGFAEKTEGERREVDHFLPLLVARYGYEEPDDSSYEFDLLFPLIHASRRSDVAYATRFLPFFDEAKDEQGSRMGIGLFLYRRHEKTEEQSLDRWFPFPLARWYTAPKRRIGWFLPFFLFMEAEGETQRSQRTFAIPIYYSYERDSRVDREGEWVNTRKDLHLWPLFGRRRSRSIEGDTEERAYHTFYPFFSYEWSRSSADESGPTRTIDAPWPILRHRWDLLRWDFRLFPLFFAGDAPAATYTCLYPLVSVHSGPEADRWFPDYISLLQWESREGQGSFSIFPLIYGQRWDERSSRVYGPLGIFYYRETADDGWFHLLPLGFGSWSQDGSRIGIFPLYYRRDFGPRPIDYWRPERFLFLWNTFESREESHLSLLWKLMEYTGGRSGDYDVRVLHRLFVNRKARGQREVVVNPFFSYWRDESADERSFSILHFVFRREREGDTTTTRLFLIPIARSES